MQTQDSKEKKYDPQAIKQLLKNCQLKHLLSKAQLLANIENLLHKIIPHPYSEHCQVMNLEKHTLKISVDSAAWAMHLRYMERELLNKLLVQLPFLNNSLKKISFRIRPIQSPEPITTPSTHPTPSISPKSAQLIESTAKSVSHPDLKASLMKLSRGK